jgi:hypothetical protein
MARTDLDGARLRKPGEAAVWLIFQGLRHHVADSDTYSALFANDRGVVDDIHVCEIAMGPELNHGSCLARAQGEVSIYLVFGRPRPIRCYIPTLESFAEFGFDMDKVCDVPRILLDAIPVGPELQSAADRARRGDFV